MTKRFLEVEEIYELADEQKHLFFADEKETEEEKIFQKGVSIGFVVGAFMTFILTTGLFLIIGLYY